MKKNRKTLLLWFGLVTVSMQQCNVAVAQCETCDYTREIQRNPNINQKVNILEFTLSPIGEYEGCPDGTLKKRNISFVHGLGGDAGSWEKPATWTADNYITGVDKINYSGKGWETSFYSVAKEMNNQLYYNKAGGVDQKYPGRCKYDDYVIAHSQGGVAARHLDRYWDINQLGFGKRKFYGLVTFGTSHSGAHVALTRDQHHSFIQKVISAVVIDNVDEGGYDLTRRFGLFIGTKAIDVTDRIDSLIEKYISPVLVSSLHTHTLEEMEPGCKQMNWINNHVSRLHKVSFYGVEDAPESWRVINDVIGTGSSSYPLFTAEKDDELLHKMESIRAHHNAEIAKLKVQIRKRRKLDRNFVTGLIFNLGKNSKLVRLMTEYEHRQNSVDFLNRANTEWRYLIGAYHPDSFEFLNVTEYVVKAELKRGGYTIDVTTLSFPTKQAAEDFAAYVKQFAAYQTSIHKETKSEKRRKFFPSDGVVLAKSQVAFPGVQQKNVDIMPGDNHFQERNSPNTKRVLESLYKGDKYDDYFMLEKR